MTGARSGGVGFWPGFAAGVAATIALVQIVAALRVVPEMRSMLRDFGVQLPLATRLGTSHVWSWGVPVAVLTATWFGIVSRPSSRRGVVIIAIPLGALAALIFTIWACYLPIFQLAGNIKPD